MSDQKVIPTDEHIINSVKELFQPATYVVRNRLRMTYPGLDTTTVRRRLMALEQAGKVERLDGVFARQFCWRIPRPIEKVPG